MRMEFGLRAADIGKALGLHTASIWRIHSEFFKYGATIFINAPHGGRHYANLSVSEEEAVLAPFLREAENSGIITVSTVQRAYERKLGRKVALSTVYRALERYDWRKLVPRPSHPKADQEAQAAFKKNFSAMISEIVRQSGIERGIRIMFQDEARFGRVSLSRRA